MMLLMEGNQKEDGRRIEEQDSPYGFSKLGEKTSILSSRLQTSNSANIIMAFSR